MVKPLLDFLVKADGYGHVRTDGKILALIVLQQIQHSSFSGKES
jgi:hypothetical protein